MSKKKSDPAQRAFLVSAAVLVFGYGVAVGALQVFPFALLHSGWTSVKLVLDDAPARLSGEPVAFLKPARYEGSGVTVSTEDASPGLTLLAGFFEDGNELRLLELDGTTVARWPVRFSEIFPDDSHVIPASYAPATDWNVDLHGALALPDGSVVFNFEGVGTAKLDRCGAVVWTVPYMTHHSLEVSAAGGFWVLGRQWRRESGEIPVLPPPYYEDEILELSAEGEILRTLSIPQMMVRAGLAHLLLGRDFDVTAIGDELVHANSVEELLPERASAFPMFEAGDLVVSLRNRNLVLVIDPRTEAVDWFAAGPWIRQHDATFTSYGTISLVDNHTDASFDGSVLGGSRIVEIDPASRDVRTLYGGRDAQRWYTDIRGKHQWTREGNLLVTEAEAGRAFEVDTNGGLVWEYINRYDEGRILTIGGARRYPTDYFEVGDWSCG